MKDILVPTDFSRQAENALRFAVQIAQRSNTKLHIIHAVEYQSDGSTNPFPMLISDSEIKKNATWYLEEAQSKIEELCANLNLKYESWVEFGNPFLAIRKYIVDRKIDLVVMGTRGASELMEIVVGSNAERVVRTASCPVITVHEAADLDAINHIAFAIDIDKDISKSLFNELTKLQSLLNAQLHLVHINTPNTFKRDEVAFDRLRKLVTTYDLKNVELHTYNDLFREEGILLFAEEIDAGLIAIGTHGRRGLLHLVADTMTENVLSHAKRPVWSFHI